ncbi:unnamed protein product, partial [marine sediment metagenome]
LILVAIAWIAGIVITHQLGLPASLLRALIAAGVAGVVATWRLDRNRLAAALALAAVLGGWRYTLAQPPTDDGRLSYYNDLGSTSLRGFVSADPSFRDRYTQLEISALEIERGDEWLPVRGKLVLKVPHYPEFEYGDSLRVTGLLETPPVLDDFSYKEYLASRGVHSLMRRAQVTALAQIRGSGLVRWMYGQKKVLRGVVESILPNPDAGLLSGILLGLGHTLPDYLEQAFRNAGLT